MPPTEPNLSGTDRMNSMASTGQSPVRSSLGNAFKAVAVKAAESAIKNLVKAVDLAAVSFGKARKETEAHTKALKENTKAAEANAKVTKNLGSGSTTSDWGGANNPHKGKSAPPGGHHPFGSQGSAIVKYQTPALQASGGGPPAVPPSGGPPVGPYGGGGPPAVPPGGSGAGSGGVPGSGITSGGGGGGGGMLGTIASMIPVLNTLTKAVELAGTIATAGAKFGYERIEGPTGNRNAMLQFSQAIGPAATMAGLKVNDYAKGLAVRTPVMGSFSDILQTIQSGQDVGAQLLGTPQRNGYFEAVRQMQALTPGIAPSTIAGGLNSYMNNVSSQQKGAFYGGGAFTMMGKGGRFKSLGEWAEQISKYLYQQRPGNKRGQKFSADELVAQNFPGSNINAWFQFMGVPPDMVDYWWQWAMVNARSGGGDLNAPGALQAEVNSENQRGIDLSHERLRNVTQATRREFMLGTPMMPLYAAREGADRRFNVAMGGADMMLAQMSRGTNMGTLLATLPTPIVEMFLPIVMKMMSSPLGVAGAGMGQILSIMGRNSGAPIDPMFKGDDDVPGDVGDIGDYGKYGGTSTRGLSPDLASRINAMRRANPNISITSGHRDSYLQGRLQRGGVGRVGPASRSGHTRGWAADLGPASQYGWIKKNAHKFGLQHAAGVGEPWHVQVAGTMPVKYSTGVGDATPIGGIEDVAGSLLGGGSSLLTGGIAEAIGAMLQRVVGALLGPLMSAVSGVATVFSKGDQRMMEMFVGSFFEGNTPLAMVDRGIQMFTQYMMAPTAGMMNLFGRNLASKDSDYENIINSESSINIKLPKYTGFSSISTGSPDDIFGDPYIGDTRMRRSGGSGMSITSSPVVFNNVFHINGVSNPHEAREIASTLAGHLEQEMGTRRLRVS